MTRPPLLRVYLKAVFVSRDTALGAPGTRCRHLALTAVQASMPRALMRECLNLGFELVQLRAQTGHVLPDRR